MHHIKLIGFEIEEIGGNEKPIFTEEFHASGHASKFELEYNINKIDPDIIIPFHNYEQGSNFIILIPKLK